MFTLLNVAQPDTLQEAYKILTAKRSNTILGGSSYLRMGSQSIHTGVDLSKLGLQYIQETESFIEIGAMATLRNVEKHPALAKYFNGILPQAVSNIIGVQFRNVATVGASVFSRYGFSDLITALLVLDTEVELFHGGRMSLADFLDTPRTKDILTKVIIPVTGRQAAYYTLRNSASDYPLLAVAVSCYDNQWQIAVGARPTRAKLAVHAAGLLTAAAVAPEDIEQAAQQAAEELPFGDNMRASAEYRRAMCRVLVKRAVTEVAVCK
ncbi:xanthine dehydrogenase family protein subunit M [Sporomusa aerivorans]|uniref:FAD binding domain-containing protein n=1 Tax=Sporomusa aerivorans TaxID=204936 RepID=UPI00352A0F5C